MILELMPSCAETYHVFLKTITFLHCIAGLLSKGMFLVWLLERRFDSRSLHSNKLYYLPAAKTHAPDKVIREATLSDICAHVYCCSNYMIMQYSAKINDGVIVATTVL